MHSTQSNVTRALWLDLPRQILGALAQLGERLICIQEVRSSILLGSTNLPSRSEGRETPLPKRKRSAFDTVECHESASQYAPDA